MLVELLLDKSATFSSLEYGQVGLLTFGTSLIVTAAFARLKRSPAAIIIEKKRLFFIVLAFVNIIKSIRKFK